MKSSGFIRCLTWKRHESIEWNQPYGSMHGIAWNSMWRWIQEQPREKAVPLMDFKLNN